MEKTLIALWKLAKYIMMLSALLLSLMGANAFDCTEV